MDREGIKNILPHREPMLLLDDVEEEDGTAIGHYRVRGDEYFLRGHFPDNPIVPGVIQCEILAQSLCILLKDDLEAGRLPMYTGLNNVIFRRPVRPGDLIETRCSIIKSKPPFYRAVGKLYVDGVLCTSAELSVASTKAE